MLDKRLKPVRDVTRGIRHLDRTCSEMIAGAAQLALDMVHADEACGLPIDAGQEAFTRLSRVFAAGIEARGLSANVHEALLEIGTNRSVPAAWGDDCPVAGRLADERQPAALRAVS